MYRLIDADGWTNRLVRLVGRQTKQTDFVRETDRATERKMDRQTNIHFVNKTGREIDRQTDSQTDSQTVRQ